MPLLAPWLTSLLTSMTALDPSRRPRAAAVADAFSNRDALAATSADHTAVMPVHAVPRRRWRLLAALAAIVLALAVILFLVGGNASTDTTPPAANSTTVPTTVPTTAAPVTAPSTAPTATQPPPHQGKGKGGGGDKPGKDGG